MTLSLQTGGKKKLCKALGETNKFGGGRFQSHHMGMTSNIRDEG